MRFPLAVKLKSIAIDKESLDIISKVFPTKQESVLQIRAIAKQDGRIKKIILFGSAITLKCGDTSDIDIAIDADVSREDFPYQIMREFADVQSEKDILNYNDIHSDLLKESINKGVCIYAKRP